MLQPVINASGVRHIYCIVHKQIDRWQGRPSIFYNWNIMRKSRGLYIWNDPLFNVDLLACYTGWTKKVSLIIIEITLSTANQLS